MAEEYLLATSAGDGDQPLRMTTVRKWNPMILYESKPGGNLLLKENIDKIYKIEKNIKDLEKWPNVCLATSVSDQACSAEAWASPLVFLSIAKQY